MTLKLDRVLEVVEVHVHAKFHHANVAIMVTETEKNFAENNTVVITKHKMFKKINIKNMLLILKER